ncbi:HEAT repeat domain-containing protein [Candidatus Poribacteria bacterium]|nr:HEAT repeat domain-containing protein [Candidatus Poribacteria bacterium]
MKKSLIVLLLIGVVSFGCQQKQIITQLEVGRKKLLDAGLTMEAVGHLERAEVEEVNKVEPRALLVIAYGHAISTGAARVYQVESRFQSERDRRIAQLGEFEIKRILEILGERHRVQKDAVQVLVDRGASAVPFVLENLVKNRYTGAHDDFYQILKEIGGDGVDTILKTVLDSATPVPVKVELIRTVGEIGDATATAGLEQLHNSIADKGLKMEVDTALYLLGHPEYKEKIVAGLNDANVVVRRAAAKALVSLEDPPVAKIVEALKDTDGAVRMYAAKALQKYHDASAVDNLIAVLNSGADSEAQQAAKMKQTAMYTLHLYAEKGMADGLAARFIELLTNSEVTDHNNRLRIVQLLKKPVLIKQVEEADQYDNLPHKIYQLYEAETNDMVKDELIKLLDVIKQDDGDLELAD